MRDRVFRKNLLTLLTGTTISQALGLLFLPILTRIYEPEAFGRFGMYYAAICVLGILATWRMEMALMLPKEQREARQIWKTTLWLLGLSTLGFACLLMPSIYFWPGLAGEQLKIWSALVIGLFLIGFAELLMLWLSRAQMFKIIAAKNVLERISVTVLAFLFAYLGYTSWGLIWAQLATLALIVGFMLWATYPTSPMQEVVRLNKVRELVGTYRDFPLMQGWSTLFVIGATQLPNLLFGSRFDMEATGNVNLAYRIFEAPVNLFAVSFSSAFYQHISHLPSSEISRLFKKSASKLCLWLLPGFVLIGAIGPFAFPRVFGDGWKHAGDFAIPLAAATFFKILYLSHSSVFLVVRRLDTDLKVSGSIILAQVLGFYVTSSITDSPLAVVSAMSGLSCLAYIFGLVKIYRLGRAN